MQQLEMKDFSGSDDENNEDTLNSPGCCYNLYLSFWAYGCLCKPTPTSTALEMEEEISSNTEESPSECYSEVDAAHLCCYACLAIPMVAATGFGAIVLHDGCLLPWTTSWMLATLPYASSIAATVKIDADVPKEEKIERLGYCLSACATTSLATTGLFACCAPHAALGNPALAGTAESAFCYLSTCIVLLCEKDTAHSNSSDIIWAGPP